MMVDFQYCNLSQQESMQKKWLSFLEWEEKLRKLKKKEFKK
jgi:hypothetical protein